MIVIHLLLTLLENVWFVCKLSYALSRQSLDPLEGQSCRRTMLILNCFSHFGVKKKLVL